VPSQYPPTCHPGVGTIPNWALHTNPNGCSHTPSVSHHTLDSVPTDLSYIHQWPDRTRSQLHPGTTMPRHQTSSEPTQTAAIYRREKQLARTTKGRQSTRMCTAKQYIDCHNVTFSLPRCVMKFSRRLPSSPQCLYCKTAHENRDHVLQYTHITKVVWHKHMMISLQKKCT
jgi:hypothetical protein